MSHRLGKETHRQHLHRLKRRNLLFADVALDVGIEHRSSIGPPFDHGYREVGKVVGPSLNHCYRKGCLTICQSLLQERMSDHLSIIATGKDVGPSVNHGYMEGCRTICQS